MKMKRLSLLLFLVPFALMISSCVKEGCTDEEAINYDENADDDNGKCVYKDTLKQEIKDEERETYTFSIDWDGADAYEGYSLPISLENRSVLLYMEHPDWSDEWAKMPFSKDNVSYYYTEKPSQDEIWIYAEKIDTGNPALSSGTTTEHKAVVLTNEFLEANPDIERLSYSELQERLAGQ